MLSSFINLLILIQDGTSKPEMEVSAEYWTEFNCDDINQYGKKDGYRCSLLKPGPEAPGTVAIAIVAP